MTSIYAICYTRGPKWHVGKSIFEQPLQEHLAYMKGLRACGSLLLGGPFVDDLGGLVVVSAGSLAAADHMAAGDPAVREGLMVASVHPWKLLAGEVALGTQADGVDRA